MVWHPLELQIKLTWHENFLGRVLKVISEIFSFKGMFYDQIKGAGNGSSLAPVLAKLFLGHDDKIWFDNYIVLASQVLFYTYYVDDTFSFHCLQD